jgi:hypothetical protein
MPDTQPALFRIYPRRLSRRRRERILEWVAAELERKMQEADVSQDVLGRRAKLSEGTVSNILRARNTRVSSVVDAFQAVGYRLQLELVKIEVEKQ